MRAYELVPEAYRQKFRNFKKGDDQTYVEFAREKEILFDRWCGSQKVSTLEQMRQLVLLEEFKRSIPSEIRTHLNEQHASGLSQAAVIADDYALTHKQFKQTSTTESFKSTKPVKQKSYQKDGSPETRTCYYCKLPGH